MRIEQLNQRRLDLGMSLSALAKLSGLSLPTVQRVLSGSTKNTTLHTVLAIAAVLGVGVDWKMHPVRTVRRRRAEAKATELVGHVQGSAGLEGQAVDRDARAAMVKRTVKELLDADPRSLWE